MKKYLKIVLVIIIFMFLGGICYRIFIDNSNDNTPKTVVKKTKENKKIEKNNYPSYNGYLKVSGTKLVNDKDEEFILKGVSSHGIQWFYDLYTKDNFKVLKEVVQLLEKYQIRYPRKQQHLSDFFERLLTTENERIRKTVFDRCDDINDRIKEIKAHQENEMKELDELWKDNIAINNRKSDKKRKVQEYLDLAEKMTSRETKEVKEFKKRYKDATLSILSTATGYDKRFIANSRNWEKVQMALEKADDRITVAGGMMPEWMEFYSDTGVNYDTDEVGGDETLAEQAFNVLVDGQYNKTFNENDFEEEKSSTSNGMTTLDSISKGLDMFDKINRKKSNKKEGHKNLKASEKEKKKLENESKALIDKYQEIKKDNRILEIEISNYKKLANQYLNFGNNYKNKFNNKYSQKTINELEQSVKQNIQNNCLIIDTILKIQKNNEILSSKIEALSHKMKLNFQKIEKKNRKNAEIQITNEENEQKVLNLKDEKQNLLHELETQKIYLMKLKYKEDNLNLLNESNKKALNDKEEHILKLKNTINQYNKYKNKLQENRSFTNDNIQAYDEKINNLRIEINNLNSIKQKILVSNSNAQKQLLSLHPNNLDNNNEQQLNDQLNEIKIENTQKKISLKEKEKQLDLLKNEIDSFTLNIKNNNQLDEIQKNKIKNLINVIDNSENNDMNEKNINEQIKLKSEINLQKNNQIEQLYDKYQKAKIEKDQIIQNMEAQVNQLYLNNQQNLGLQQFDKNNIYSIKDLTLDDEIGKTQNNANKINEMKDINELNEQNQLIEDEYNNNLDLNNEHNELEENYDINNIGNGDDINKGEYLKLNENNNYENLENFENENINENNNEFDYNQNEEGQIDLDQNMNENVDSQEHEDDINDIKELKEDDDDEAEINEGQYVDENNEVQELENINEENDGEQFNNEIIDNNNEVDNMNEDENDNIKVNDDQLEFENEALQNPDMDSKNVNDDNNLENQITPDENEIHELDAQENIDNENNNLIYDDNNNEMEEVDINELNDNQIEPNEGNEAQEELGEDQNIENQELDGNYNLPEEDENIEELVENPEELDENNNNEEEGEEEINYEEIEGDPNENFQQIEDKDHLENEEILNREENKDELEYNLNNYFDGNENNDENNQNEEENNYEEGEEEQEQEQDIQQLEDANLEQDS